MADIISRLLFTERESILTIHECGLYSSIEHQRSTDKKHRSLRENTVGNVTYIGFCSSPEVKFYDVPLFKAARPPFYNIQSNPILVIN